MRLLGRLVIVGVAASVSLFGGTVPLSAGSERPAVSIVVRTIVLGSAAEGSTVHARCEATEGFFDLELGFDAAGIPTSGGSGLFFDEGGAWVATPQTNVVGFRCTLTETASGGATNTTWTCAFHAEFGNPQDTLGCQANAGSDAGPATVVYGGTLHQPTFQAGEVVFTNTYGPLMVAPNFTG